MPTWMKVLLVVGVLLVLLVVGGVVTVFLLARSYGPGLMEAGKHSYDEGATYGRRTDNEGCLNETVARHARTDGLGARIKNGIFMRACLDASRPTPGFCDGVPPRSEFVKSIGWQALQCQRYGLSTEQQCNQLFGEMQKFCDERRANPGGGAGAGVGPELPPPPAPTPPPSRVR